MSLYTETNWYFKGYGLGYYPLPPVGVGGTPVLDPVPEVPRNRDSHDTHRGLQKGRDDETWWESGVSNGNSFSLVSTLSS